MITAEEIKRYDDDDDVTYRKLFFYRIERYDKVFYFYSNISDEENADFNSKMLDYYIKHKTLDVEK